MPFVSRYHTGEEVAVDVLAQDIPKLVRRVAGTAGGVAYCFAPACMRSAVVQHARACGATVLLILPAVAATWLPLVEAARVWQMPLVAPRGEPLFRAAVSGGRFAEVHPERAGTAWRAVLCAF